MFSTIIDVIEDLGAWVLTVGTGPETGGLFYELAIHESATPEQESAALLKVYGCTIFESYTRSAFLVQDTGTELVMVFGERA